MNNIERLERLKSSIEGEVLNDSINRIIYSTDASSYRERPLAVVLPKTVGDIQKTLDFARNTKQSIIPRAAGTSLAGQVVGKGVVVDCSKYMNQIIELNVEKHWVKVQPGVNLTELNKIVAKNGLQFGPETSSASRCCLGGMLGNNACGAHSIIYGSVRDHILEIDCILSDGSTVLFKELSTKEFDKKRKGDSKILENRIYQHIYNCLSNPVLRDEIRNAYPEKEVKRRNMGYAVDSLMDTEPFGGTEKINVAKLLAGSEGTLAFTTALKINLVPLPPKNKAVIVAQFNDLRSSLEANIVALKYKPGAVEMMDDNILLCTKENIEQRANRFFIKGDPKIVLVIEFARETRKEIETIYTEMTSELRQKELGYHFDLVEGKDKIARVWELRKAGLGLLSNIPGDNKSTTVIEDTAVAPHRLPQYIEEFNNILKKYELDCVHYAHVATGELHLRPLLNLKTKEGKRLYETIAVEIAALVKKHKGSLSGEHGDGRLRGAFIPFMYGDEIYKLFRKIKQVWDPNQIMNPGKIVDAPVITKNLRYELNNQYNDITTVSNFSSTLGFLRAVEKCNGSGDCRKSSVLGGTMCPTFMATRDESKSTRGRANVLREFLHHSTNKNPLDHPEIMKVLDLCISCKACKSECPSNVDMAKMKAEVLQAYYDKNGAPFRSKMIAYLPRLNDLAQFFRSPTNWMLSQQITKNIMGFHPNRSLPIYEKQTVKEWFKLQKTTKPGKKVLLFADEFINFQDAKIGKIAIQVLESLQYNVEIANLKESGRTFFSKGFLREGKKIAQYNVEQLYSQLDEQTALIGLEPSTILSFRDEYPDLVNDEWNKQANELASKALLFEEFFMTEVKQGAIRPDQFTNDTAEILVHGHCQQKAVASTAPLRQMLSFPKNYSVEEIPSGCCGMAGSFGYEKEHYELSNQIGETILFPSVRKAKAETIISAPGTSCRHHIYEGTNRKVVHPVEIMWQALKKE